jgi:hypothetical protein
LERLTEKSKLVVPEFPSLALTLPMEIEGSGSSLRMVPVAVARRIEAFVGPERVTVKVSSGSYVVSPLTLTVTVRDVTPGEKLSAVLEIAV